MWNLFLWSSWLDHLVVVLPVPLLQKSDVVAHGLQHPDQLHQLLGFDLGGDRAVAVLLGAKVDKVGPHAVLLTTS